MNNRASAGTIGIVLILLLIVAGIFIGTYIIPAFINRSPGIHQSIIDATTVKAMIHFDLTAKLEPVLLRNHGKQKVTALNIVDITKRARWYEQEVTITEWAWEYKGQPLAYMKISGPLNDELYIEFSKASMTRITVQILDQSHTFEVTFPETYGDGFWVLFVELES